MVEQPARCTHALLLVANSVLKLRAQDSVVRLACCWCLSADIRVLLCSESLCAKPFTMLPTRLRIGLAERTARQPTRTQRLRGKPHHYERMLFGQIGAMRIRCFYCRLVDGSWELARLNGSCMIQRRRSATSNYRPSLLMLNFVLVSTRPDPRSTMRRPCIGHAS